MTDRNIFGTPEEPFFNDVEKGCLPFDLLEELFHYQARCNAEGLHLGSSDDGNFKHGTWSGRTPSIVMHDPWHDISLSSIMNKSVNTYTPTKGPKCHNNFQKCHNSGIAKKIPFI